MPEEVADRHARFRAHDTGRPIELTQPAQSGGLDHPAVTRDGGVAVAPSLAPADQRLLTGESNIAEVIGGRYQRLDDRIAAPPGDRLRLSRDHARGDR
jgi:hypothetical protein